MDPYEKYFHLQVGVKRALGGVGHMHIVSPYSEGHGGIDSFPADIFRRVLFLLTRRAKAVGRAAMRTGMNIV